jgi:hypothetical protein
MPNSQTSRMSGPQRQGSNVDESLFGTKKNSSTLNNDKAREEERRRVAQEILKGDTKVTNATILSQDELLRIKNSCVIMSKEEEIQQKRILEEQKEKQQAAAKAKKQKMLAIEETRKTMVPLTDMEEETKHKNNALATRAEEIHNENLDEVKNMNQMLLYAKCVTIRDKQLDEKKNIVGAKKTEEKRKDLMMEIERLKKIKYYEELEKSKKEELKSGHMVIIDQIKEREMDRLRKQEEKEREGQEIIRGIKQLEVDEANSALKKKTFQKKMLDEIYDANHKAISVKQYRIIEEKAEEEKIVAYNIEKAQKDAEYQAEQRRIKEEKEREVARLREMQEKANDRQAELDALRAKRAVEMGERLAREKERNEAEKRHKNNQELFDVRQLQSLEKQKRLEDQAKQDRDEFQRIIVTQKQDRDLELKLEQEKKSKVREHADELKKQMALNEEKKKQDKRDYLEEGKKVKDNLTKQKRLLEDIKTQKMEHLKENSIPDKYHYDLAKKKIVI